MSSPPHQETAANFAQAAQCLDFGGQQEKCCLPASFCEEPVPAEPTQNSYHAAGTALIQAAALQPAQDLCGSPLLLPPQSRFLLRSKTSRVLRFLPPI